MMNNKRESGIGGLTKIKAKLLTTYYGKPLKDMKMICVAGTAGKVAVAHMIHQILEAADQRVAILASDQEIKMGTLHKFLGDAWKAGANYVIVTTPGNSLAKGVFYGLPVSVAVMTDYVGGGNFLDGADSSKPAEAILFEMEPEIVVVNHDDENYPLFRNYAGTKGTLTYGKSRFSDVLIESSKLYKKGVEDHLNIAGTHFTVASFLTGEQVVNQMAAAAAVASALKIGTEPIIEGIANYEAPKA